LSGILILFALGSATSEAAIRNIIVDTDWSTDVDDVVAMRSVTLAHRQPQINLLAVMQNTNVLNGPRSLLGFLHGDKTYVPVGVSHTANPETGRYQANLYSLSVSQKLITGTESYPDAVRLYRQVLAAATTPVDIISIGYLNNLRDLLASGPDAISPLTGVQLVAAKVGTLNVMGGAYPSGVEHNFSANPLAIASSSYLTANWPRPIVYSGFSIGVSVLTGQTEVGRESTDFLAVALHDFGTFSRSSWDPMNALQAIAGDAAYTSVSESNWIDVTTGENRFTAKVGGRDKYLVKAQPYSSFASTINAELIQ
jgi:hypothetical protein